MLTLPTLMSLVLPQAQDPGDLQAVLEAQAKRTAVVARVMPAVCSVMALDSPGGGSGVIIDPLGFVLSNFHVVKARKKKGKPLPPGARPKEPKKKGPWDPARKVMKIGLPDGRLYKADVLGIDPGSDLAILLLRPRGDGKPYPYAKLGDSDKLLVGEAVFAMGNPFLLATDFTPTVTWGIVSGTHRYQPGGGNRMLVYPDCVQVDAPVNPGNSGGPLFNEAGEVVGINGRITVRDRGRVNTGVGFAISSNQIANFLGDLMAGKHAEHGTLDLNAWYMKQPGQTERRVIVQSVFADSQAAKLGLRLGDHVTTFNEAEIRSANQMATLVGVLPSASWITLGYRSFLEGGGFGKEKKINFKLTTLDTGSSRNPDRIAPPEKRKKARVALTRAVGRGQKKTAGATFTIRGPRDQQITISRLGDSLHWRDTNRTLVRQATGKGFAIKAGKVTDLDPEAAAKLEREFTTNPWLWRGDDLRALLKNSTLEGGLQVHGRPAYRCRLVGEGEKEIFFFDDGTPAGYRYRDPVRREKVDYLVRGHAMWIEADGKLARGWSLHQVNHDALPSQDLFKRPSGQ